MSKININDIEKIKDLLQKEAGQIKSRIAELVKQDPFSDPSRLSDNAASDAEANEESDHDRVSALIDELKSKVKDINLALSAIDRGVYGKCISCGNPIDMRRLSILPTATHCQDCESKQKKF